MTDLSPNQAGVLAECVALGIISRELADKMLRSARLIAEPCPTCIAGRGRQCVNNRGNRVALHADRIAAASGS